MPLKVIQGHRGRYQLKTVVTSLCSRLSSSKVPFYTENGRFTFMSPPLGGYEQLYDVRFIAKHVVDFLLVLIELFR